MGKYYTNIIWYKGNKKGLWDRLLVRRVLERILPAALLFPPGQRSACDHILQWEDIKKSNKSAFLSVDIVAKLFNHEF